MYLCKPTRESLENWRQLLTDELLYEATQLKQALQGIDLDSEQELEDLLWEYTRLFIGPDRLPCPPLESVYTSSKRLVMQDAYGEVQEFYARIGIEVSSAGVMPDHIGAELNFISILYDKMACESEKQAQYQALAEDFSTSHLRNWTPRFTKDMEDASVTPFYKALAKVSRDAVT